MTARVRRIVFAGLMGQPMLPLARSLALAAAEAGWPVALWDPHAVRPGPMETHLNLHATHGNARVSRGDCDLVAGLEALEGLRSAARLYRPGLRVALLDVVVPPAAVATGGTAYPRTESLARDLGAGLRLARLPGPGRPGAQPSARDLATLLGFVTALVGDLEHRAVRGAARLQFPGWPDGDLEAGYERGLAIASAREAPRG